VRERKPKPERKDQREAIAQTRARMRERMMEHTARIEAEEAARGYKPGTSEFADEAKDEQPPDFSSRVT
jgi:hypothetical protein